MDASNPVADSTRVTLAAMRERKLTYKRQDLGFIDRVCQSIPRTSFERYERRLTAENDEKMVQGRLTEKIGVVKQKIDEANNYELLKPENLKDFLVPRPPVPVCGLMVDGVPIHPTGKNVNGKNVSTTLTFGGIGLDKACIKMCAAYMDPAELSEIIHETPVYTKGTVAGLRTRMKDQMSRPVVQCPLSQLEFETLMEDSLPLKKDKLIDWNSDLYEIFENIKTSYASSAGAPYWRQKQDTVDEMLEIVLPMVVKALQTNTLNELFKTQPELFLSVVKNKDDRYEKPDEKTRPYISLPWHFQVLFSALSQSFSDALYLFYEKEGCRNAYGFSYANGGGNHLFEYMHKTQPGKPRFIVYGDDVDFYFKDKDGNLYRVCPDFKQMDGSVDATTIDRTINWIYNTYARKYGENQFWRNVCGVWKEMAVDPLLLVEGPTPYKKKHKEGLMTGIVGTTLFDTVKSIVAYEELINLHRFAPDLLNVNLVSKFFKKRGLVIKDGTWNPQIVPSNVTRGEIVSPQKFLGMQLLKTEHNGNDLYVPVLPTREWFYSLLAPRERVAHTAQGKMRYLFDRLRGLLATGAVFDGHFRKVAASILSEMPGSAIVMEVQQGGGKGMRPELVSSVGLEFEFSNSSGWPTLEWALNLYSPEDRKIEIDLTPVFEDVSNVLSKVPKRKPLMPVAFVADVVQGGEVVSSTVIPSELKKKDIVVEDINSLAQVADETKLTQTEHVVKSPSKSYDTTTGKLENMSKPSLQKQIQTLFQTLKVEKMDLQENFRKQLELILKYKKQKNTFMVELIHNLYSPGWEPVTGEDDPALLPHRLPLTGESGWAGGDIFKYILINMVLDGATVDEAMKISLNLRAMVRLAQVAERLGQSEKIVEKTCRGMGLYVFGPPNMRFVSTAPVAPLDPQLRIEVQKQQTENKINLIEVKEKLKHAPVDKQTTNLVAKKQILSEVVARAEEMPAQLPPSKYIPPLEPLELPKFKFLDDYNARAYLSQNKKTKFIVVSKLLRQHDIAAKPEPYFDGGMKGIRVLWTFNGNTKEAFRYAGPQNALLLYYKFVLEKYIRDVEPSAPELSAPGQNWYDMYQAEKAVRIRVYMEQGRPILFHLKNWSYALPEEHESLRVQHNKLYVKLPDGRELPFNLNHKMQKSADQLAAVLGSQIEVDTITYASYLENFPDLEKQLNVSEYIDVANAKHEFGHVAAKATETGRSTPQKAESRSGSKSGEKSKSSKKKKSKSKSKEKQTPPTQVVHEQVPHESRDHGRFRLPRDHHSNSRRQNWSPEVHHQRMPFGMGWHPYTEGGSPMATLPPPQPGFGGHFFSQPHDGWPIFNGMVGGFRRPYGYPWGRGPF
ncbi:MAG: RNA-dependent RNA polymerase [Sanya permutotetra-like virus 3]|nr:MAG: RNA-dependent RNA polymerase [Sanya permutotetra-like virus 3]